MSYGYNFKIEIRTFAKSLPTGTIYPTGAIFIWNCKTTLSTTEYSKDTASASEKEADAVFAEREGVAEKLRVHILAFAHIRLADDFCITFILP